MLAAGARGLGQKKRRRLESEEPAVPQAGGRHVCGFNAQHAPSSNHSTARPVTPPGILWAVGMPLTAQRDASADVRDGSSPVVAGRLSPPQKQQGLPAAIAPAAGATQSTAVDKRSMDYIVRSGIAGGLAGCAVSGRRRAGGSG